MYGLVGALIAVGLQGITLLALVGSGLQVWLSQNPAWPWFKASAAAAVCALILMVIVLGKEFSWWQLDGEVLDTLGVAWVGLTLAVAGLAYWLFR